MRNELYNLALWNLSGWRLAQEEIGQTLRVYSICLGDLFQFSFAPSPY